MDDKDWPPFLNSASVNPAHWEYHAEGAANILFRYKGPRVWPFCNTRGGGEFCILRIPKVIDAPDARDTPLADEFVERVLSKVLPRSHLPCLRRIQTNDAAWHALLQQLALGCEPHRPVARQRQGRMDVYTPYIWVMRDDSRPYPNAASDTGANFVVEIKVRNTMLYELTEAEMWLHAQSSQLAVCM